MAPPSCAMKVTSWSPCNRAFPAASAVLHVVPFGKKILTAAGLSAKLNCQTPDSLFLQTPGSSSFPVASIGKVTKEKEGLP